MSFELTGKILDKGATQQVSDRFKKREFVVERSESSGDRVFTDFIKFQLTQDKCDIIEPFQVNDEIKISFNIKGNKWERDGKVNYFTNLDAWRIERAADESAQPTYAAAPAENDAPPPPPADDDYADDLPF